ncbi:hypothetical protein [Aureimonas phyllosphaerae]|uniref:Uncharacterized protein n=1 Tax=Aureimonas phyllosphaerae TaxID=1166078 RepID=A0A7W6BXH3_9HYPH|nr:hypothetical protein [Aureimonas phyllosphaerae]MBB3934527.1 hypothetical protein [Aureimonas phyllosphaerae]MBB3958257.1 hypothetical protein [Aureimonas phyllosphaerae]SFE94332.1 hypothetical protein SAMN05216566_101227 [Aureimonas phyllosphaerae]
MIVRLSVVTSLLALFAVSFSTLVERDRAAHSPVATVSQGCYDQGAVCVR